MSVLDAPPSTARDEGGPEPRSVVVLHPFPPPVGRAIGGRDRSPTGDDVERLIGRALLRAGLERAVARRAQGQPVAEPAPIVAVTTAAPAPPPLDTRAGRLRTVGPPAAVVPIEEPEGLSVRRRQVARAVLWVRNVGLVIFLFALYQLFGTSFAQHRAQAELRAAFDRAISPAVATGADNPTLSHARSRATPGATPPALPGGVIGRLEIPAIHLDQFVVEGTGEHDLQRGPGHYAGTPVPGQPGNVAIAGHRTTYGAPFSRLDELKPGDAIVTTTARGSFLYVVSGTQTVSPGQTSVVDDYGDNRLTLTTCTPKFSATHRLVVTALLQGPAPAQPVARVAPPAAPANRRPVVAVKRAVIALKRNARGFDVRALLPALAFGLLLVGLSALHRPLRRRVPRIAAAAVVAPVWCALLLGLFEQLTRFLPPNV